MKRALLLALLIATSAFAQSGRDYYNELVKADGLRGWEYVCFRDSEPFENFWVFSFSADFRRALGDKITKKDRELFKGDFILLQGYQKGIPWDNVAVFDRDGESYALKGMIKGSSVITRFKMNPQTFRYRYWMETAEGRTLGHGGVFGKCELVSQERNSQ